MRKLCFIAVLVIVTNSGNLKELVCLVPPLHVADHKDHVELSLLLHHDGSVATAWAGIIPYFHRGYAVDLLGKCDKYVARQPYHLIPFMSGHMKWDYSYSLRNKPTYIISLWRDPHVADLSGYSMKKFRQLT